MSDRSLDSTEQALIDFPDNPEFTWQLGGAFFQLKDFTHSIEAYGQCVQMGYKLNESYYSIAQSYRRLRDYEQSIAFFLKAIDCKPKDFHSISAIARIHLYRGDLTQANKWARNSLKLNPKFIYPVSILIAIALIRKKDDSLPSLIRKIEESRHMLLRATTEDIMSYLGEKGYKRRLDLAFKSFSTPNKKRTLSVKPSPNNSFNRTRN